MPSLSPVKQRKQEEAALRKRDELLAKAGITTEWRQTVLKKAYKRLDEQLDATKHVDGSEVVDNQARLRAIEQVIDFEGVSVGKAQEGGSHGPVNIYLGGALGQIFSPQPTTGSGEPIVIEAPAPKVLE